MSFVHPPRKQQQWCESAFIWEQLLQHPRVLNQAV